MKNFAAHKGLFLEKTALVLTLGLLSVFAFSSCCDNSPDVKFSQYQYSDSSMVNGVQGSIFISVDYPNFVDGKGVAVDTAFLNKMKPEKRKMLAYVDSIRLWISRELARPEVNDTTEILQLFNGDMNDGSALVNFYGKWQIKDWTTSEDYVSLAKAFPDYPIICERRNNIVNLYKSKEIISMVDTAYIYEGGAHGSSNISVATFGVGNGHKYGWDMFKAGEFDKLAKMVKEELLKQFFTGSDDMNQLLIDNDGQDSFPLPQTAPVVVTITNKDGSEEPGFMFIYQQYEIVCYAAGIPSCTISYKKLKEMLAPGFAALLESR